MRRFLHCRQPVPALMVLIASGTLPACGYYNHAEIRSAPHTQYSSPQVPGPVPHAAVSSNQLTGSCAPLRMPSPGVAEHAKPGLVARDSVAFTASQAICGALRELQLLW